MRLDELFDNNAEIKWNKPLDPQKGGFYHVSFNVAGRTFDIDFVGGNDEYGKPTKYNVDFQDSTDTDHMMFHNTGLVGKEAYKVFSNVIAAIKSFVTTMMPQELTFGGWKDDGRDVLYSKLLKYFSKFAEDLGYEVHTSYDDLKLNFTISKKLTEAPLADFGIHGDTDSAGSYTDSDVKAFKNDKWLKKVESHFSRCPFNFHVYLFNAPQGKYHLYTDDAGNIDTNTHQKSIRFVIDGMMDRGDVATLERMMGTSIPNGRNAITFIMSDNEGDAKVGLTPWILVHRLVHGLLGRTQSGEFNNSQTQVNRHATNLVDTIERAYGNEASKVYKFKSAQNEKITRKGEFIVELFTQYIVQGKVTINHAPIRSPFNPDGSLYLGAWDTGKEEDADLYVADHSKNPLFKKVLAAYQKAFKNVDLDRVTSHDELIIKNEILNKIVGNEPRVRKDNSYNIYQNGNLIAATSNPERYEGKEGYTVEKTFDASPENIAKQEAKVKKWHENKQKIGEEFETIFYDIHSAISYYHSRKVRMENLDRYVDILNEALENHLKLCVGNYFMISGRS